MADKSLTDFLGSWSGQMKSLVENSSGSSKIKLTPEFSLTYHGITLNGFQFNRVASSPSCTYIYVGDGILSVQPDYYFYFENGELNCFSDYCDIEDIMTVSSSATNNYEAGEWIYPFYVSY